MGRGRKEQEVGRAGGRWHGSFISNKQIVILIILFLFYSYLTFSTVFYNSLWDNIVSPMLSECAVKIETPRGVLGSGFAGYVPLASQNPQPIIVYSVANYRSHLSHFGANVIVISRTEFSASRMLNIKTTAWGTIFQPRIFLFLNPCLPEFSYPKNPENLRPPCSNSTKNVTPL